MDDVLTDGMTDESNELQMEGIIPGSWTVRYFPLLMTLGILSVKSADGRWTVWTEWTTGLLTDGWISRWNCEWAN